MAATDHVPAAPGGPQAGRPPAGEPTGDGGRLRGRVALITGAARGQGEAEARRFVAEGARVVLADILDGPGRQVAEDLGPAARFVHLDVTRPDQWTTAVEVAVDAFGKLDALVNNAGVLRFGPVRDCSLDDYLAVVNVNQVGVLLGMRAAIPALEAAGGGTIVNTSSINGFVGIANTVAYSSSKFAVRAMTRVAALELAPLGIRVNAICPGSIDTPMVRADAIDGLASAPPDEVYAGLPLGRVGQPTEIAAAVVFLTSDESSYCTGTELVVDGGMLAGPSF